MAHRKHIENADRAATAARFIRALGRNIGDGDPYELELLGDLELELERVRVRAVAGLRAQGHSWGDVAAGLGVSRAYAHRQYAPLVAELELELELKAAAECADGVA